VGIESPILVPLDGGAALGCLDVDLGAMQPHRRSEQLLEDADELGILRELAKEREVLVRRLDPSNLGVVRLVEGLEVVDVRMPR
jgi:hypothetical protein